MLVNSAVLLYSKHCRRGTSTIIHWHQTFTIALSPGTRLTFTSTTVGGLERYNKGIIHVRKFCTFDCYDILPALKQEVQFDAHEFHLSAVPSIGAGGATAPPPSPPPQRT